MYMLKTMRYLTVLFFITFLMSCNKDDDSPTNPFDSVDYSDGVNSVDTLDPNGIVSIHRDIILPKCSTPGCHDGTFEPDFRTVMSSYSTLVYHPIIKNDPDTQFTFRVVPFDTTMSVLQKRLNWKTFANTNDRMPQDNIGTGLPKEDLDRISNWILNGAPDPDGNVAILPNQEPKITSLWIIEGASDVNTIWSNPINRLSSTENRVGNAWYGSSILDTAMWLFIIPGVEDDSTAIEELVDMELRFSYDKDDFSNPLKTLTPVLTYNKDNWYFNFKLDNTFNTETVVYTKLYVNDGDHIDNTHYPRLDSHEGIKLNWSFIIVKGSQQ